MRHKINCIANFMLAIGSLFLFYVAIELFAFPWLLTSIPLKFQSYLGDVYLLSQSSKKGLRPRNYIALVGDSYAQGLGDWLQEANPNQNGAFHSAHVIHENTDRDVISFGKGGAGSVDGTMFWPIRIFSRLNSSWQYNIERPTTIVVYFYEGNDLNNNLETIRKYTKIDQHTTDGFKQDPLQTFVERKYHRSINSIDSTLSIGENTFFMKFLWGLLTGLTSNFPQNEYGYGVTKARVNGKVLMVPDGLQSPAMELSEDEIAKSIEVFELSLKGLRHFFADARVVVTVIPSPLSVYELASDEVQIQTYQKKKGRTYPAAGVRQMSHRICSLVAEASARVGAEFVDVRGRIRSLARKQLVHGPKDWKHFNKRGYTVLGEAVSDYLRGDTLMSGECGS